MKKIALISILLLCSIKLIKAQGGGAAGIIVALSQRSTVLYSDTMFEMDQLKFKVTETYAFRNKIKTTIILFNKSDNYKIIYSEDFTITDSENNAIVVNTKRPIVIAPKTTKKIGLMAESKSSFKLYDIKLNLKQIYTSGPVISNIKTSLFNLHEEGTENIKTENLDITRTKCAAYPNGSTKVFFKLIYTGPHFLAINGSKAMMLALDKKAYINVLEKSKRTYFPKEKNAITLALEFDNSSPIFTDPNCDKVSLENVFTEHDLFSDNHPIEIHVYKNGMNEGDSPLDKKEREDITED